MKKIIEDPDFQKKTTELGYTAFHEDSETSKGFVREWYKVSGELYDGLGMKKR